VTGGDGDGSRDPRGGRAGRAARLRDRSRAVRRIARWEASKGVGSLDRRTVVLGLVSLVLAAGVAYAGVAGGGVSLDQGVYRVGVADDSPYRVPVADTPSLAARPVDAELGAAIDVRVRNGTFAAADTRKGRAATAALRGAVQRYNDRVMAAEENQTAAFPVFVRLRYTERDGSVLASDAGGNASGGGALGGAGGTGGGGFGDDGRLAVPDVGGGAGGGLLAPEATGSPADIQPPFPFASLVLAFAFLVPMNFVVQAYGSTMLNERINRRGELLLVAPVAPGDIVAGKTLPYLAGMVAVTAVIALAVGGGPLSVLAVTPLALLFLGATFVSAMFARSFKELTFLTVTVSTSLTTYAFVPAIFTEVTPIALISPLTVVVRDLGNVPVAPHELAFSTAPPLFVAGALFLLGAGVYREEDMFTQRSVPMKALDALDARLSGPPSVAVVSALAIPFVFVVELVALAGLFPLPRLVTLPLLLVLVAVVEEVAKSVHVFAGFESGRFDRSRGTVLLLGALSGLGFFVGEKATAVVQLVGLQQVGLGRAAFATAGVETVGGPLASAGLLLAPLVLHAVTAIISAAGASRGRDWYAGALGVAVLVHAVYNLSVVVVLLG
jgi:ABC-type Na+ efflux pump permease subunit